VSTVARSAKPVVLNFLEGPDQDSLSRVATNPNPGLTSSSLQYKKEELWETSPSATGSNPTPGTIYAEKSGRFVPFPSF
jgi:hypothetical protein